MLSALDIGALEVTNYNYNSAFTIELWTNFVHTSELEEARICPIRVLCQTISIRERFVQDVLVYKPHLAFARNHLSVICTD